MVTKQDVERKEIDSLLDLVNIFKEYKTFQIILKWKRIQEKSYLPTYSRYRVRQVKGYGKTAYRYDATSGGGTDPDIKFQDEVNLIGLIHEITEHIPRYVLSIRIISEDMLYDSTKNLIEEIKKLRKEAIISYLTSQLYQGVKKEEIKC